MNIDCTPTSIFSWNYRLKGGSEPISLQTNWMTEQGSLTIGRQHYEIHKQSFLSGEWHLLERDQLIWRAYKPNPFKRRFELTSSEKKATLAASGLGRTMVLDGPNLSLTLSPNHPFTRRATIQGRGDDLLQTSFAFWLTVLVWKRAANSASAGGS